MAILMSNRVKSSYGRLRYLLETAAHDGSVQRTLGVVAQNVNLLHDPSDSISATQSAAYIQRQFARVLSLAKNKHKAYQAESVILSFSDKEFPPTDDAHERQKQVQQALELTTKYARTNFPPGSQWVATAQRDGEGHKLHVHLLVNAVQVDGRVLRTCNFNIPAQRKTLNEILQKEMPVMGLSWDNPQSKVHKTRADVDTTNITWQETMKSAIADAVASSNTVDLDTFAAVLAASGVTITMSKRGWTYSDGNHRSRDFYQRIDKLTGEIKSTRGLGRAYTPDNIAAMVAEKVKHQQASQQPSPAPHPAVPSHKIKKEEDTHESLTDVIAADRRDAANKLRASLQAGQLRRTRRNQQEDDDRNVSSNHQSAKSAPVKSKSTKSDRRSELSARRPERDDGPEV